MLNTHFHRVYEQETADTPVDTALQSRVGRDIGLHAPARNLKPWYLCVGLAGAAAAIVLAVHIPTAGPEKIDDWAYAVPASDAEFSASISQRSYLLNATVAPSTTTGLYDSAADMGDTLGLSAGGAEDANAFRDDIANGYVPLPTDLTYEGLFSEYFFETGAQAACKALFCPSYATGISPDPFTGENDYYLSVGLNSGVQASDFARQPLNIVIALDISGSMSASLEEYHYDATGWGVWDGLVERTEPQSKMDVAKEAVIDLLGHLRDEDRVGVVLFDSEAVIAKPLREVAATDMARVSDHVREIEPQGGTNMSAGIDLATSLFEDVDQEGYENRIIFITDAMPNGGDLTKEGMRGTMEENAANNVYTTFIGVGVDFQTELVETITKTQGANYYAVHSSEEFRERMDEGFDYMVTPLVFDLDLSLDAEGFDIAQVYGSPEANTATGEIMHVNTIFPSVQQDGETKGGVILLKLTKTGEREDLALRVTYTDRNGKMHEEFAEVTFGAQEEDYANPSVEKAVWLARYAELMKNWMSDAHYGSMDPFERRTAWEQQPTRLWVSDDYKELFSTFRDKFASAVTRHSDMQQELHILDTLLGRVANIE